VLSTPAVRRAAIAFAGYGTCCVLGQRFLRGTWVGALSTTDATSAPLDSALPMYTNAVAHSIVLRRPWWDVLAQGVILR